MRQWIPRNGKEGEKDLKDGWKLASGAKKATVKSYPVVVEKYEYWDTLQLEGGNTAELKLQKGNKYKTYCGQQYINDNSGLNIW